MGASQRHSDLVAVRLARASERLRSQPPHAARSHDEGAGSLTAADALVVLREACDGLAATELEVRRVRAELERLAAQAAARDAPLDAA